MATRATLDAMRDYMGELVLVGDVEGVRAEAEASTMLENLRQHVASMGNALKSGEQLAAQYDAAGNDKAASAERKVNARTMAARDWYAELMAGPRLEVVPAIRERASRANREGRRAAGFLYFAGLGPIPADMAKKWERIEARAAARLARRQATTA